MPAYLETVLMILQVWVRRGISAVEHIGSSVDVRDHTPSNQIYQGIRRIWQLECRLAPDEGVRDLLFRSGVDFFDTELLVPFHVQTAN